MEKTQIFPNITTKIREFHKFLPNYAYCFALTPTESLLLIQVYGDEETHGNSLFSCGQKAVREGKRKKPSNHFNLLIKKLYWHFSRCQAHFSIFQNAGCRRNRA